jgi:hypothetical protein
MQINVMRAWFFEHFTDPAENTPYESAEGGYIYIWGGPFVAGEELQGRFSGIVPDDRIEELAQELNEITIDWTGQPDDYIDSYLVEESQPSSAHKEASEESIDAVRSLLKLKLAWTHQQYLLRLLYANVITALETYLSGFFLSAIQADHGTFCRFVETTPSFAEQTFKLSEVFKISSGIKDIVDKHLLKVVWHRFDRVARMYKDTLGISFPSKMGNLYRAILIRHDIVHRNGTSPDGMEHRFGITDILSLSGEASKLVSAIEAEWAKTQ